MPDKIWFLRRLNLFEGMSEADIEAISRQLRERRCPAHRPLVTDSGDRVYLVKAGRVRLYHLTAEGQEVTTAVLAPGQLFGLGSLFGDDSAATHAEPLEESWVCEAGAQDFLNILARHPLLMARVVMVMARQIFHLEQTIESIASQPVGRRLAGLLLSMQESGQPVPGGVLLPRTSQDQLAKLIGTTRESVSRTLADWRRERLIAAQGRRIVILEPSRLRRL